MNKITNNKIYSKFFKILISNLFFLFFLINQNAISKPVPPGSGEGDVPANILILLVSVSIFLMSPISDSISSATLASSNKFGEVLGLNEYPFKITPIFISHSESQPRANRDK